MRKLMSLALTLVMSLALATPIAAAEVGTSGNTGSVPVALTAEAAAFSVTVPTSIPMSINSDAEVTCATNLSITNNTAAPVEVTNIEVQSGTWSIVDYNDGDRSPLASEKVNSNKLGLALKPAGGSQIATSTNGTQNLSVDSAEWVVSAGGSLSFECAGIATAVSSSASNVQAAKVVFTLAWKDAGSSLISFTIDNYGSYQAEEGMTWESWVSSPFNTDGWKINKGLVVNTTSESGLMLNHKTVLSTETICNNANYSTYVLNKDYSTQISFYLIDDVIWNDTVEILAHDGDTWEDFGIGNQDISNGNGFGGIYSSDFEFVASIEYFYDDESEEDVGFIVLQNMQSENKDYYFINDVELNAYVKGIDKIIAGHSYEIVQRPF